MGLVVRPQKTMLARQGKISLSRVERKGVVTWAVKYSVNGKYETQQYPDADEAMLNFDKYVRLFEE